jgi:gamma-glutamyltranspeptidase/glutathione hydrolase
MRAHQGLLSEVDLDEYRVVDRQPRRQTFRGATVTSNPAPSFGGSIVAAALAELDAESKSSNETSRLVTAMKALATATSSAKNVGPQSSAGTTHISVIDSDGMAVAMTTSNGSCSGVMVPGTGVQLNNVMGEEDLHPEGFHATEPGTRIGSMMAPTLLDPPDGTLVALGSGGSERIRSALLRVIVALVDGGYPLQEAVNAPRIHHDGTNIHVEPGVRSHTLAALTELAPVKTWPANNLYFGGVHAVAARPDGTKDAAADPRRDGASAVVTLD